MSSLLARTTAPFPVLADWLTTGWPFGEHNPVRIEESTQDGKYTVRAELPGFDPDNGITVAVERGVLTIRAVREAKEEDKGRSEFHYGSFRRSVVLPSGAETGEITANYADGILEVVVPYLLAEPGRPVVIEVGKS